MGDSSEVPALRRGLAVLRLLATRPGPVTGGGDRPGSGAPPLDHLPPAQRAGSGRFRRAPARRTPLRPGHRGVRAGLGLPAPRSAGAAGRAVAAQAGRPGRAHRPPRRPARQRVAVPDQGAPGPARDAGDRGRRPAAGAADRVRPGDPGGTCRPRTSGRCSRRRRRSSLRTGRGPRTLAELRPHARRGAPAAAGRSRTATSRRASPRWPARSSTTAPAPWPRSASRCATTARQSPARRPGRTWPRK